MDKQLIPGQCQVTHTDTHGPRMVLESRGLPRRPSRLMNLYRPVWQRQTRGKGFGKEGRSLAILAHTLRFKYLLVGARSRGSHFTNFCVFLYFLFEIPSRH